MFSTRAFLSSTLSPSLFALNFKSAFTISFSCKTPPEWVFSHLLNQALLSLLIHRRGINIAARKCAQRSKQETKKHAEETWEYATVCSHDLVLLLGNCEDTIEIYVGRSRFDRPKSLRDPHATMTKTIHDHVYCLTEAWLSELKKMDALYMGTRQLLPCVVNGWKTFENLLKKRNMFKILKTSWTFFV